MATRLLVLLATIVAAPVPLRAEDAADTGAGEALELLRMGAYQDAIEAYREVLAATPDDHVSRRNLGKALIARGQYEAALEALTEPADASPSSSDRAAGARVVSLRGRAFQRMGRLKEAEAAHRRALEIHPSCFEAIHRLGEVLRLTGRREEAKTVWNTLIDHYQALSTEEAEALPAEEYVEMALALIALNRYKDADQVMFPQAEEQDKECAELYLEWGRAFNEKYNWPDARSFFRDLFKFNPHHPDARVALAENYLTDYQVGTERFDLAEKQIDRALEVNPQHPGAFTAKGSIWLYDGNLPEAEKQFSRALEICPTDVRARGLLAACAFLRGDMVRVKEIESAALEINPQAGELYHIMAEAVERRFRYKDAAKLCEKALAVDAEYWPAYATLAINLLRTGDEERGRFYLEKAWETDRYNIWVLNTKKLMRHMDANHRVYQTGKFVIKLPKDDAKIYETYLMPVLEEAYAKLPAHYETELEPPVQVEVFTSHNWFSARLVGLPGVPAAGACFGNLIILSSPRALPQNWGAVAWHEFAHIVTLHKTKHRVPRWLTEGLSTFEEGRDHPAWGRNFDRDMADAFGSGRLLGVAELDFGFTKPKYPGQVLMSYYQGCMIVRYVIERWGFDAINRLLVGYDANRGLEEIFRDVLEQSSVEFDAGFFAWLGKWVEANGYTPVLGEEIIEKLQIELEDEPDNAEKLTRLAWAYLSNGNDIDAPLTAAKAYKLAPESGDAAAVLAFVRMSEKKKSEAKKLLEEALANGTRFKYRVYHALAGLALEADEKALAVELFEKAKETSPRAGAGSPAGNNTYHQLAKLYEELEREDDVVRTLEELRAISAEDAGCRARLAQIYLAREGVEPAKLATRALDEAIYIQPFDPKLHEDLARAALRGEEWTIAIREFELLLEWANDFNPRSAHRGLAKAYLESGNADKAATHAQEVLDFDDEDAEAKAILEKAKAAKTP